MTDLEKIKLVDDLNTELFNKLGDTPEIFSYTTTGTYEHISLGNIILWNSENNERKFIEKLNEYEPLEVYLKRELSFFIKRLNCYKKIIAHHAN